MFLDDDELNNENLNVTFNNESNNNENKEQYHDFGNGQNSEVPKDQEIEVVMGDDSNLEISIVGDLENDLKPRVQKRGNIVIPIPTKIANKESTETNNEQNNTQTETNNDTSNNESNTSNNDQ